MDEIYLELAFKEAKKAENKGEIPVGCIIVKNNKIISKAHNKVEKDRISLYHAEIIAILKASKKLKNWRLNDCTLYTTLEPCMMCCGAIMQSRIKKIVYGAKNLNNGYVDKLNKINIKYIKNTKYENIIKTFFKNKR